MKHLMYGTVSALALLLTMQGGAKADATLATSVTLTEANAAAAVLVDAANTIDDLAFFAASGAFQVQQNNSINSIAAQNAAIDARSENNQLDIVPQLNTAVSVNLDAANLAIGVAVVSVNLIEDAAFEFATGEFQVQQNHAINSITGQNMGTTAISDPRGLVIAAQLGVADADNDVLINRAIHTAVINSNTITDDAFAAASGAFQVQQNASINSSVQQNAAISAISAPGGAIFVSQAAEAELDSAVAGNLAVADIVRATNNIDGAAFFAAKGMFQVQQNNSINSAVTQNMAVSATSTH